MSKKKILHNQPYKNRCTLQQTLEATTADTEHLVAHRAQRDNRTTSNIDRNKINQAI